MKEFYSQPAMQRSFWQERENGFTLVEMMIAVVIIAILLALAAPSFRELVADNRVKGVASDLHVALLNARSEAISHNASVTISPVGGNWASGWQTTRGTVEIENHPALKAVSFTAQPGDVTYTASGRIQGTTAPAFSLVSSTISTAVRCVSADLSGRPYVKKASSC